MIQHYLYCPHRWGLMEIECCFSENIFVYKGNLVHENIDNKKGLKSRGVIHENSVHVYNDGYNIQGIVDCLEFRKDMNGVYVEKLDDIYAMTIVEYKVTAPKDGIQRYEDKMQVLAQKLCVDHIYGTSCEAFFYYANTRKRERIQFEENDYIFLKETLDEMTMFLQEKKIPPIRAKQYCVGCSMKDICLPMKRGDTL